MAATIQTIVKPTRARGLDTSGNNNHAQIYSGRALEFDGVADYLSVSNIDGTTNFDEGNAYSWATWINFSSFTSSTNWFLGKGSSHPNILARSTGRLAIREAGGNAAYYYLSSGNLNANTWYRLVVTADTSNNLKTYINGVLDNTLSEGDSPYSGSGTFGVGGSNLGTEFTMTRIGGGYTNNAYPLNGMMSDFQIWNTTLTQDDVTYDYLNPEQLALNRGGTSLTNSNLKLWYPMNEGHRGNQSYILDASNTGLGDDLVNWSSTFNASGTSTSNFGNWTTNANNSTTFCTWDHDNKTIRLRSTDGTHVQAFYSPDIMQEGVTYKFEYTISELISGSVRIRPQDNTDYIVHTEVGTYSYITTPTDSDDVDFRIERNLHTGANDFTVSDVKIYPINDKHNATTVFYGDEMITNDRNQLFDEAGQWGGYNGSATAEIDGGKFKVVTDGDGTTQGAQLLVANLTTPVVGRTYRITAKLDDTGASAHASARYKFQFGGADALVTASDGSPSNGGIDTTEQEYYADVVADDAAGDLIIKVTSSSNDEATTFTIDDVSVKEIGVASGWTGADQQLDIPQTALQSYNQLAFSDDYRSGIALSDGGTTTHQITTNNHTWSFWMFRNQEDSDTFHYVLQKGEYQQSGYYIYQTSGKLAFVTNTSGANQSHTTDATVPKGKWFHAAITVYSSGTASQWYINGQAESSVTGITAPVANTDYTSFYAYDSDNNTPPTTHPGYQCLTELSSWNKQLSKDEIQEIYNDGLALDCTTHSASANLVGYWRNNGLAEWEDLSTNNYHGTPTSITETMLITAGVDSSRDSQGFLMNRQRTTNTLNLPIIDFANNGDVITSSDIEIPNPSLTYSDTGFSFECWFKAAKSSSPMFIVAHQEGTNNGEGFHVRWAGANTIYAVVSDGTNEANAQVTGALNADQWYHIVVSWDHTNKKKYVYIDGILRQVETESSVGTIAPDRDIHIGTRRGEGSQMFIGQIDDVKLYDRILTDGGVTTGQSDSNGLSIAAKGEVLRNYNAGKRSHR